MDRKSHWERVYRTRAPTDVSWYQPRARISLELIQRVAPDLATPIIDVGGGASTLVDGLLDAGYSDITVLDLASSALASARSRLGSRAAAIRWIESDVLAADLREHRYALWHDRAVFHFLVEVQDRQSYVRRALRSVQPGGFVIAASFGPEGPERCSGLDVVRYNADSMHAQFGPAFTLLDSVGEEHLTPGGAMQSFIYCLCRRSSAP